MRHFFHKHTYKIALGLPVVIILAASSNLFDASIGTILLESRNPEGISTTGESFVDVYVESRTPINAVESTITFPNDAIEILSLSTEKSIISLWTHEPTFSNEDGTITFSGGIINKYGFLGKGTLFTLKVRGLKDGSATFVFDNALILAHDGKGTNILETLPSYTYAIKDFGTTFITSENPALGISDIGLFSLQLFRGYDPRYDLNGDGKINVSDLTRLISLVLMERS